MWLLIHELAIPLNKKAKFSKCTHPWVSYTVVDVRANISKCIALTIKGIVIYAHIIYKH